LRLLQANEQMALLDAVELQGLPAGQLNGLGPQAAPIRHLPLQQPRRRSSDRLISACRHRPLVMAALHGFAQP
jgi:hypothetical protein